jgi:hypothetical protein
VRGGKLVSTELYFGLKVPHTAPAGTHTPIMLARATRDVRSAHCGRSQRSPA